MSNKTEIWKQASEVYADVSELSVQQALAHIYGIKNITTDVREAVITLINAGSQASQFYRHNISNKLSFDTNNTLSVGQHVDEYELLELLGQGGMSQVFKAKRLKDEHQKLVAIKIFSPRNNSPELLDHFINEQKILSQFSHPNIVDMLHGGKTSDNTVYLVMELIDGALTIDEFCTDKHLSVKEKISYIAKCAEALTYSHANLIIHRDLKPENILIAQNKQLKIVDFGIAKLINNDVVGNKTTIMALTPNYAAPEQINSQSITVKTDVFSLAIVALDLLSDKGIKPLPKDRLIKSCANDQHYLDELLKKLKIDKDLKNILQQASHVEPGKRYANMHLFAEDLNNYLANKPVSATAPSLGYRLTKFAKRRRALFATLVTLLVTLTLGFLSLSWQYQKTLVAEQKAVQVKDFMLGVFSYTDPEENIGQKLSALDLLAIAEQEIKYKVFNDKSLKSDILSSIGIAFVNLGGFEDGEINLLESLELNPENIDSQLKLIQLYLDQSTPDKATPYFESVENLLLSASDDYTLEKAELLVLRSTNTTYSKDVELGIKLAKQAQVLFNDMNNAQGVLKSTRLLTEKMFNLKEDQEPVDICLEVIKAVEDKVSPVNTELLRLKTSLTWMYNRLGQFEAAKPIIDDVIVSLKNTLGNKHPAIIDALIQRAGIYKSLGMPEQAIKDANESYEIAIAIFGENSQYAQQGLSMLSTLRFQSGERKQAQSDLEKVVAMSIINYGEDHRMTFNAQIELSNYMAANGDMDLAIKNAQKVQNKLIEIYGEKHPQTLFANNVLIKLLSTQEVDEEIIKMAITHKMNTVEVLGIDHPQSAYSFFVLGNIYSAAKQFENANNAYKKILEHKMVKENNPRYVALTIAIAKNYQIIDMTNLAIEFATKGYAAAIAIFGEESTRAIESQLFLVKVLLKSPNASLSVHMQELQKLIHRGIISDQKKIDMINTYQKQLDITGSNL